MGFIQENTLSLALGMLEDTIPSREFAGIKDKASLILYGTSCILTCTAFLMWRTGTSSVLHWVETTITFWYTLCIRACPAMEARDRCKTEG